MNLDTVLFWIGVLGVVSWWGVFGYSLIGSLRAPRLIDQRPPDPSPWPKVAIIVPSCNDEHTIEAAMRTLLALDYPSLQVVAVNDRSTDGTGAVLDRLAAESPRLTVVHVKNRPEDWLGKVNAMSRGVAASSSDLILFSDSDVHFAPQLLKKAVALFQEKKLDHLALLPRFDSKGVVIGALLASFFDGYLSRVRSSVVEVKKDGPPFGFGAFNLIRRSTFEKTQGFEWFKMDIIDDVALGELMKQHGTSGFAVASRDLSLEYYPSLRTAMLGWEKNMPSGIGRYRVLRTFVTSFIVMSIPLEPFALFFQNAHPELRWLFLVAAAPILGLSLAGWVRFGRPFFLALLSPMAMFLVGFGVARAGILWLRRGGIIWRGTFYPTKELREGRRVTYP